MLAEAVEVGEFSADHSAPGEETPELSLDTESGEDNNEEIECFFTTVDLVDLRVGSEAASEGKPATAPGAGVDAAEDTAEEGYEAGKYESTEGRGEYFVGTYSCMTRGRLLYWYGEAGRLAVLMGGS